MQGLAVLAAVGDTAVFICTATAAVLAIFLTWVVRHTSARRGGLAGVAPAAEAHAQTELLVPQATLAHLVPPVLRVRLRQAWGKHSPAEPLAMEALAVMAALEVVVAVGGMELIIAP